MAKTSTERSKLFRKKLRGDVEKYSVFKAKDREQKRNERNEKKPLSESELQNLRKKNRERKRKSRMKKKAQKTESCNDNNENVHAYQTPQALGKAVRKVKSQLPKSPRKRKAVITKLATPSGLVISKHKKGNSGGNKKVSVATITKVQEFFCKDYVSRQAPGKKDFVIKRQSGKKDYLQKRHMMFSLKEAHSLFQKEHPEVKIGLSKFSSLRPVNVLLSSDTPRNVCLCQYHENIRLICDCLSKEIEGFPTYSGDFVDKFVCDSSSEECMLARCQNCATYIWLDEITESCDESCLCEKATWNQWERVEVTVPGKKNKPPKVVKKTKKVCKEGTINDVFISLRSKLPNFLEHVFVKRKQSSYFEERKSNLQVEEAIVQVDFAENYSCKHQDEIQSPHWNQQQITLFTVAVWTINEANDITCESHVIVSDDLEHEKTSVVVFMSTVLETLVKQKHPEVTKAYIFSDGPSSQFKNKYIVSILSKLAKIVQVQWNYFATSHGKGVVDGIGGTIKRLVWNAVQSRRASPVTDAKSFHELATTLNSSVSVHLMEKKEIRDRATSLGLSKSFKEAVALPGISRFHCIEPQINGFVQSKMYSTQNMVEKEAAPLVFPFDLEESGSDSDGSDTSLVEVENDKDHDDISSSDPSEENDSNNDLVHETSNIGNEDEEKECPNDGDKESSSSITIKVDHGLPSYIPIKFESIQPSPYNVPLHTSCLVDGILSGHIKFQGNHIIDDHDLKSLIGGHKNSKENYLTNFVIDEYLSLLKATSRKVSVISWEVFHKFVVKRIFAKKENLLTQDLILVLCNSPNTEHWYLLVVFPLVKVIAVLDSMAGSFVKPNAEVSIKKMWVLLKMFDSTLDEKEWHFAANKPDDLPQQNNNFDCEVFVTLYARCLIANSTLFVELSSLQDFKKHMVAELHKRRLIAISPKIQTGMYYAVDYVNKFYIGRALETNDKVTKFQFLHGTGAKKFDWPRSNDIESKHSSCVFYGPITLLGNRPFEGCRAPRNRSSF